MALVVAFVLKDNMVPPQFHPFPTTVPHLGAPLPYSYNQPNSESKVESGWSWMLWSPNHENHEERWNQNHCPNYSLKQSWNYHENLFQSPNYYGPSSDLVHN